MDPVEGNTVIFRHGAVIEDESPGEHVEEQRLGDEQHMAGLRLEENRTGGVVDGRHYGKRGESALKTVD